jgi:hypothetical protein
MKTLKAVTITLIMMIGLNGCGSSKSKDEISYLDSNLTKGMMIKKILEDKGLYSFELFNFNDSFPNFNKLELEIFNTKLNIDKLVQTNIRYSFNGDEFIKTNLDIDVSINNPIISTRELTDNGWESRVKSRANINDENITFNRDGYISENSKITIMSIDKLENLSIKSKKIEDYILEDSLFSKDTLRIESKIEFLYENNITILDRLCFSPNQSEKDIENMKCQENLSKRFYNTTTMESSSSEAEEIEDNSITFSSMEEFLVYFKKGGENFLQNYRYSNQFDENGTVYYFEEINNQEQKKLTGRLKLQTLHGVEFYEIETPKDYKYDLSKNNKDFHNGDKSDILIELDGNLQRGTWQKSNSWMINKEYNNKAINEIKKAIERFMKEGNSDIE